MRYNARKIHPVGPKKELPPMTVIRKLNPRLALPFAAIAVVLIAAAAVIAPSLPPPRACPV